VVEHRHSAASPVEGLVRVGIWLSLLFAGGCRNSYTWVARDRPWSERSISGAAQVRLLKTDGIRLTLDHPSMVEGTYLTGTTAGNEEVPVRVDLSDIYLLEVNETTLATAAQGLVFGIAGVIAIWLYFTHGWPAKF
jgi:hypothetical protein